MSVTLRYSGTMKDMALLPRLREDFQDIAATHAWPVDLVEAAAEVRTASRRVRTLAPPLLVEGLRVIVHPQTDPLWLTFDPEGVLTRMGAFPLSQVGRDGSAQGAKFGFLHQSQASMQTSIGGSHLHRTLVSLLDYLKRAYVPDLQVMDETGYWDVRDDAALRRLMDAR